MKRLLVPLLLLVVALTGLVAAGTYDVGPVVITQEGHQKIILMFGDPRKITTPGPDLRIPLLEETRTFERRLLYLNTEPLPIQTEDQERLVVDNYVVWRIADPVLYFASFPADSLGDTQQAESQIDRVIRAGVREVVGRHTLTEVVSDLRVDIMQQITRRMDDALDKYGIEVRDVRINRTELPATTEQNVFARMKTERERLARKHRAEGEEQARRIRAEADREARVIVAHANRDGEMARGVGDAEAARIYAAAYSKAPEFYDFTRSLEAYRKTIGDHTTLVLSPDAEFFRFLQSATPGSNGDSAP